MKQLVLIGFVLLLGIFSGALISPLLAQSQAAGSPQLTCFIGENSNAACGGKWIFFAGNTSNLDESAWIVRISSETGEIWYKDGKTLRLLKDEK